MSTNKTESGPSTPVSVASTGADSPSPKPAMHAQIEGNDVELTYAAAKSGGANKGGEYTGIYVYSGTTQKALVKSEATREQPQNIAKDMAEFLASKIFEETAPENSARVVIARMHDERHQPTGDPYIASIFIPGYEDLSRNVQQSGALKKDGRTFAAGTVNAITGFMRKTMLNDDGTPKYTGFPETMATSLLIGDFDVHTGNIGIKDKRQLVRIDYAAAFEKLEDEIHPNSRRRHPVGLGPTNHFREYPRSLRISPEFAEHAFAVAERDLGPKVDEAFRELSEHYEYKDLVTFGERLGMKMQEERATVENQQEAYPNTANLRGKRRDLSGKITTHLKDTLKKRQESLKQYAVEISIDLCFDAKGQFRNVQKADKTVVTGQEHFAELMQNHRKYFEEVAAGTKKLHFRDNIHKTKFFSFLNWTGLTKEARMKKAVTAKIRESLTVSQTPKHKPGEITNPLSAPVRDWVTGKSPGQSKKGTSGHSIG